METKLHIATFNAENFYLLLDRPISREELEELSEDSYLEMNTSIYNPNKERAKIVEIARIILSEDFDLVGLCEIGGMETLSAFNRLYLHNKYECFLHEENSRRGIYVGALIKKGAFPGAKARNMAGSFSRNLMRIDLGIKGAYLTVFVVHLKSQYGSDHGIEQRIKEVEKLCSLVRMHKCVIMGDFNGILIRGEHQFEYEPILALPFRDVLEAVEVPKDKRRTHYYFGGGEASYAQLDYIFCSNDIEVLDAHVIEGEIPINRAQRSFLPSDHLFIRARIKISSSNVEVNKNSNKSNNLNLMQDCIDSRLEDTVIQNTIKEQNKPKPKDMFAKLFEMFETIIELLQKVKGKN